MDDPLHSLRVDDRARPALALPRLRAPLGADRALDALEQGPALSKKPFALDTVFAERVPAGVLRLIATSKDLPDAPLVCTFPDGAPSGSCVKPPAPVLAASKDLRLLGSTEDEVARLLDGEAMRKSSGDDKTLVVARWVPR